MRDILAFLKSYPENSELILSKARVCEAIAEIEGLKLQLAAEREQFHDAVLGDSAETLKLTAERDAAVARAEKAEKLMDEAREKSRQRLLERDALRAKWLARSIRLATKWRAVRDEREALREALREARKYMQSPALRARIDAVLDKNKGDGDE